MSNVTMSNFKSHNQQTLLLNGKGMLLWKSKWVNEFEKNVTMSNFLNPQLTLIT